MFYLLQFHCCKVVCELVILSAMLCNTFAYVCSVTVFVEKRASLCTE